MKQKKEVRLSDIAKRLGISTVTVSKALSDKEGVGEELRIKIKELAQEMGYKFLKTPGGARNGSTGNIGIVIPSRFFSPNYSYYWYLFNHLSTALLSKNYFSMMELVSDEDEANCTMPRLITEKKVDGVIFLGQTSNEYIQKVKASYKDFILMDFYTDDSELDCVVSDDFYNSYLITKYLISKGHKNLRFVGSFEATSSIKDRYMGFAKALYESGINCSFNEIIKDRIDESNIIKMNLPSKDKLPSAFVCNSDLTAAKLISQLEEKGIKVPADTSVTGYDNFLAESEKNIPLTTIATNPKTIAEITVQLILDKITGSVYIKGRHLVSGTIIERESVKQV
ncbi:MAG: LacI family DNA-binding transcriptional regulator [Treponema sp.]|nr:LacI family DNA-binding transcriptional regulator [Treponema sp.]